VLHSGTTKTPLYVAERLNRNQILDAKGEKRHDQFFADARLPYAERAQLEDYRGSGYDRGHMAPAADQPDQAAMEQSCSLANIVPQAPVNNQKTWAGLEKATRKFAMRADGNVFVISGPVFQGEPATIGRNRVHVPTHLFKLVYDESSNRAWAHWLENNDDARVGSPISYAELVKRTGIEFLPGVRLN
jgi:endonuclease G